MNEIINEHIWNVDFWLNFRIHRPAQSKRYNNLSLRTLRPAVLPRFCCLYCKVGPATSADKACQCSYLSSKSLRHTFWPTRWWTVSCLFSENLRRLAVFHCRRITSVNALISPLGPWEMPFDHTCQCKNLSPWDTPFDHHVDDERFLVCSVKMYGK